MSDQDSKSLVGIVSETVSIERMLIESGGELTPEIEAHLAVNAQELAEKVDGYDLIIDRFESLAEFYKRRAAFFSMAASQCESASKRLKNNIKAAMAELGVDELRGNDVRFKLAASAGRLVLKDEEMVPVEFKTEETVTVINKDKLKAALKAGPVPGAEIEYSPSLRSYPNIPDKKAKAVKNV